MTAKYLNGAVIATKDDFTPTNSGVGRQKSNAKSANNLDVNFIGDEYSQLCDEVIAAQTVLGRIRSILGKYGEADVGSINEAMEFLAKRADRADSFDHFTHTAGIGAGIYFSDLATASGFAQVADGCGVVAVTMGAGLTEGWDSGYDHHHQRNSLYRCKFQISALPGTNGDVIQVGLYRDATHFVLFHSTRAGGVWPVWTIEIHDGGASATDTLTAAPVAGAWHTFDIEADATGADFWYDRYDATMEHLRVTQAPENGDSHPYLSAVSNAGGEVLRNDLMGARDLRVM